MESVRLKCGFENGIDVGAIGTKWGLSLGWKGNTLVKLKSFSSFHIDVEVQDNECGNVWRFIGFYGNLEEKCRRASWELLRRLNQDQNMPWVVMGDFNEITDSFEKKGGRLRSNGQMREFRRVFKDCCLKDLGFIGRWFTWEQGRFASTNIKERLDRGVASLNWLNLFPGYHLEHLSHSFSDHCPLLLDTLSAVGNCQSSYGKIFRFEAKWCLDSSFEGMVKRWWEEESGGILNKFEKMGQYMMKWSTVNRTKEKRNRLNLEDRLMDLYNQDPENNIILVQVIKPTWSTVNQLINSDDSTWNRELIHNLVDDDIAKRIFSIPISKSRPEDMLVWKHEGSGEHTVRSGYRVLITEYLQSNLHTSTRDEEYKEFYMDLWASKIPVKIKIHVWRLFNNLVPHYGNLARRTLCKEIVCPLCKEELENTEHLLWNKLVHEGVKCYMPTLLGFIRGYEQDLWFVQENLCLSSALLGNELWRPPDYDIIKVNFDASYLHVKKLTITAALARDYRGEVVEADTYLMEDVDDAFVAEARACERALRLASMKGFRRLIVEGDSLSVIKKLNTQEEDRLVIKSIIHNIHRLQMGFDKVTYIFVPRSVNSAAHALAMEGRRRRVSGT
ncbi:hypothetical protein Gogos_021872, partial [Gossypium gossypioides]|nr:hypothetical protein [Gossypium gossypioides]